jgi:5-methylcytosine-specific restriction endonuclease McrA
MPIRPCVVCGAHVFMASAAARPRCRAHPYPEKVERGRRKQLAAAIVRGASCVRCGAPAQEADHPVPLSRGGSPTAMQPLCRPCHRQKTAAER